MGRITDQRVVAWPGASPSVGQSADGSRLVEEDIVGFTDLSGDRTRSITTRIWREPR